MNAKNIFLLTAGISLFYSSASLAQQLSDFDICLNEKFEEFSQTHDEDATVSRGELSEWENQCYIEVQEQEQKYNNVSSDSISISQYDKTAYLGSMPVTLTYVSVQSREDEIEIQDMIVNRGSCNVLEELPIILYFGEEEDIQVSNGCSILEAEILVNGNWFIYSW